MSIAELNAELRAAVDKNLPAVIGEQLNTVLNKAKIIERELETVKEQLKASEARVAEQKVELHKHGDLQQREAAVLGREDRALKAEIQNRFVEAEQMANIAKAELAGVKDTLQQFLKSPTIRTSVLSSVPVATEGATGGNGYAGSPGTVTQHTVTEQRTESQE